MQQLNVYISEKLKINKDSIAIKLKKNQLSLTVYEFIGWYCGGNEKSDYESCDMPWLLWGDGSDDHIDELMRYIERYKDNEIVLTYNGGDNGEITVDLPEEGEIRFDTTCMDFKELKKSISEYKNN